MFGIVHFKPVNRDFSAQFIEQGAVKTQIAVTATGMREQTHAAAFVRRLDDISNIHRDLL